MIDGRLQFSLALILFAGCSACLSSGKPIKGYTDDGKVVDLHLDGSWEFTGEKGFFSVEKSGVTMVDEISTADLLPCTVIEVVDGDTIKVAISDPVPGILEVESVRLLGIDTPELNRAEPEPYANEAKSFVLDQVSESIAYLAFESKWRDSFGRLLAYVFAEDGSLINAGLLSEGLASVYSRDPCFFHNYFVTLELEARCSQRGMWAHISCTDIVIRQVFNQGRREYVELLNMTNQLIDLSDWYFLDEQNNRIGIPTESSIAPSSLFYILSGEETPPPSPDHVYPTNKVIWNNTGDIARLFDDDDELVSEYRY